MPPIRPKIVGVMLWLLLSLLLASCGGNDRDTFISGSETNVPGRLQAEYERIGGTRQQRVDSTAGQSIELDYDVVVRGGTLALRVANPHRFTVWQQTFTESKADTLRIKAGLSGTYTVSMTSANARGSYDVQWVVVP